MKSQNKIIIGLIIFIFIFIPLMFYLVMNVIFGSLDRLIDVFESSYTRQVSGDFIYTTYSQDSGYASIIGLSNEGKLKDTIVFPTTIEDYVVSGIGVIKPNDTFTDPIEINATNVYYPDTYDNVLVEIIYCTEECDREINIFLGGTSPSYLTYLGLMDYSTNHTIYAPTEYIDENKDIFPDINYASANVLYLDYDNNIYFVDDVDGTVVNVEPPIPYKEGYEFLGWCLDINCDEEFDINTSIIPSKEYDNDSIYLYQPVTLYSKWAEIEE